MKVLVTGGLGLIGHNVVQRLQNQQHDVSIIDNQTTYGVIPREEVDYLMAQRVKKIGQCPVYHEHIENADGVDHVVGIEKPSVIVHMASFPRQKVVNANPAAGADVMMRGLINMLESAKKHGTQRFVYISSSMVYGNFTDQVLEDDVCRPIGQYGIMKLCGEDLVKDYHRRGCFDYTIIRPSAVYGPLDVEDRVAAKFMLTAMRGGILNVNGAEETLDFTYVDDAADGIVAAATIDTARNNTYNITKSHSVSLLQAAEMIVRIVGKGTINVGQKDADFPSRGALNIDRARSVLNFDPKIDVEQGFKKYHEWLSTSKYWQQKLTQSNC